MIKRMTPEWRMICALWVLASAGVAGITIAMAHKPNITTIQKIEPAYKVNRLLKADKFKPATNQPYTKLVPTPAPAPTLFKARKFWFA